MQHPDEGTIHAWLDAALPADRSAEIESHVAECDECRSAVAEARGLIAASSRIVSSLDVVPRGVVPLQPRRARPWYAGPAVKAAAALLFVAAGSLVVVRSTGTGVPDETNASADVESAAAVSRPAVPAPVESSAPAARDMAEAADALPTNTPAVQEQRLSDRADGAVASASAPTPAKSASSAPATTPESAKAEEVLQASPVVVTGLAVADKAAEGLRIVRVDSTGATRITVYALEPGVELTLTETPLRAFQAAPAPAAAMAAPPPPTARRERAATGNVSTVTAISWKGRDGRSYVLRGPVTTERLEEARKKIEEDKR